MVKDILVLLASMSTLCAAYDYSYFKENPTLAPNGEQIAYIPEAGILQFCPAPGAGVTSSAISYNSSKIKSWATGYQDLKYGSSATNPTYNDGWKTPENAVGPVTSVEMTEGVVCLGDGGTITMTFSQGISNGAGYDFAVFENGFSSTYLELAYVEVSSDGVNYVRFPNFYMGETPINDLDQTQTGQNYPTNVYNLASKYESGIGHGFDLEELQYAYDYVKNGGTGFTDEYAQSLLNNFERLDLNNIGYVRIIDILGEGGEVDSVGHVIYDPSGANPGAPGFDLKGIGVINEGVVVPEPATFAVLLAAIASIVVIRRRR